MSGSSVSPMGSRSQHLYASRMLNLHLDVGYLEAGGHQGHFVKPYMGLDTGQSNERLILDSPAVKAQQMRKGQSFWHVISSFLPTCRRRVGDSAVWNWPQTPPLPSVAATRVSLRASGSIRVRV